MDLQWQRWAEAAATAVVATSSAQTNQELAVHLGVGVPPDH